MSMLDALKDYQPIDLSKKKILQGEGVIQITEVGEIESKKNGKTYFKFVSEVINVVKAKEQNSLNPGNRFELFFENTDAKKTQKLQNNLFTAGLALDASSQETLNVSFEALKGKLVYAFFSKGKFTPEGETEELEFQNYKFMPQKRLTPENTSPQTPF